MKTMLAMALVFGFSALGCGVPVEGDEQTVDEPGVLASALTTYNGKCVVSSGVHTGRCVANTGASICPQAFDSAACQGTPIILPISSKCSQGRVGYDSTPCTITQ